MCEKKGGLGGKLGCFAVAPYAGAWIEIFSCNIISTSFVVAPYAGAWIEMSAIRSMVDPPYCRSLRGSVD